MTLIIHEEQSQILEKRIARSARQQRLDRAEGLAILIGAAETRNQEEDEVRGHLTLGVALHRGILRRLFAQARNHRREGLGLRGKSKGLVQGFGPLVVQGGVVKALQLGQVAPRLAVASPALGHVQRHRIVSRILHHGVVGIRHRRLKNRLDVEVARRRRLAPFLQEPGPPRGGLMAKAGIEFRRFLIERIRHRGIRGVLKGARHLEVDLGHLRLVRRHLREHRLRLVEAAVFRKQADVHQARLSGQWFVWRGREFDGHRNRLVGPSELLQVPKDPPAQGFIFRLQREQFLRRFQRTLVVL